MSAMIFNADGSHKKVKNLGWLLKHWQGVERFSVASYPEGKACLSAFLRDVPGGRTYRVMFQSIEVCWTFLDRPVFRGAPLEWCGVSTQCGNNIAAPGTGNACGSANDCNLIKNHVGKHMNTYANRTW